jgi:Protein of unknown function (DUF2384)
MKIAEEPAEGCIVAFGRRDLVMGSRVKDENPRFHWVPGSTAFSQAFRRAQTTAGVLVVEGATEAEFVRHVYAHIARPKNKPLIVIAEPKFASTFIDLLGSSIVKYLPTKIGETGIEDTLEVMKQVALQDSVDKLHQKGILPDTDSTKLLFNPKSQRLDLKRVAKLFGLTGRRLAGIIGVPPSTADKTPDSKAIHEKLLHFERIARGLAELDDDQDIFRRWLNTPNPELSNFTPLQVIERGNAEVVADMVSSAVLGQPA